MKCCLPSNGIIFLIALSLIYTIQNHPTRSPLHCSLPSSNFTFWFEDQRGRKWIQSANRSRPYGRGKQCHWANFRQVCSDISELFIRL